MVDARTRHAAWYRANRTEERARQRAYYLVHREEFLARNRAWLMTARGMTSRDRATLRKAGVLPPYRSESELSNT